MYGIELEKKQKKSSVIEELHGKHNSMRNAWIVLCLVGNMYQAIEVCANYFSYGIVTTVAITFPEKFMAPALTLCFYAVNMVIADQVDECVTNVVDYQRSFGTEHFSDGRTSKDRWEWRT